MTFSFSAAEREQVSELYLLALCIYREVRGGSLAEKLAQAWSVRNRVMRPSWWGKDWTEVITKKDQYSSFRAVDANGEIFPDAKTDSAWVDCFTVAEVICGDNPPSDPTFGATHYFDESLDSNPPKWATDGSMVKTAEIGRLRFWRVA